MVRCDGSCRRVQVSTRLTPRFRDETTLSRMVNLPFVKKLQGDYTRRSGEVLWTRQALSLMMMEIVAKLSRREEKWFPSATDRKD